MTPTTFEGKMFCMFFALVGIPLTGIFASWMGNQLESHWLDIINKLNKSFICIKNTKLRKWLTTLMVALGLYVLIVCVPALIVNEIEGWGWFLSHYYALISITTIGFGDYVAGNGSNMSDTARVFYKLALVVYFIFGFVILTFIFKTSQQIHDKQVRKVRRFTNSVKGRLRRTSLFPSQSSSTDHTPRPSIISNNGDARKNGKLTQKHTQQSKRKSPTYPVNGHIKKHFSFGRSRKKHQKHPSVNRELTLDLSVNSTYYDTSTKDLSTVIDGEETVSTFRGSDDVFTLPPENAIDNNAQNLLKLGVTAKSLNDFRQIEKNENTRTESVSLSIASGKTCHTLMSDGCKTL